MQTLFVKVVYYLNTVSSKVVTLVYGLNLFFNTGTKRTHDNNLPPPPPVESRIDFLVGPVRQQLISDSFPPPFPSG